MSVHEPHFIGKKASEPVAGIDFEALYHADVDEEDQKFDESASSTSVSSDASTVVALDDLFINISSGEENVPNDGAVTRSGPKVSVARFYKERLQKQKERQHRKAQIAVVSDEVVAKAMAPLEPMSSAPKRKSSFSTATSATASESHGKAVDPKFVRPPKPQTLGKKMKGWLLGASSNAKVHTDPRNEARKPRKESHETQNGTREPHSQPRSIEQELKPPPSELHTPEPKEEPDTVSPRRKKKRLTLIFKKVEVHSESACGLLIEEFIDMGYFCRCLGERFHEESLQFIGRANEDDENSVVDDNRTTTQEGMNLIPV